MLQKIEKFLFLLLVFLIPTQLAMHFWPEWAFVFGIRIDYLSPTIYLTDVLVLSLLVLGFKSVLKYKKYLILLIIFSVFNICFSISPLASLFKWLKIIEFTAFAFYVSDRLNVIEKEKIFKTLFYSLITFSLIGIVQFLLGHTVGGLFYLLGERSFNTSSPGIALTSIFGSSHLRAYSTFPHPNALAGYLGAATTLLFISGFFKDIWKRFTGPKFIGLLTIVICFLLTFSLSAILGLGVAVSLSLLVKKENLFKKLLTVIFVSTVLVSLSTPIISIKVLPIISMNENISERLDLSIVSGKIINQHFWIGTGMNTNLTFSRLLQPVHNIFLLSLSELGILGLLLLILYFYTIFHKSARLFPILFVFIIVTGFFDHYWLTINQNLLLLSLVSGLILKVKK